MSKRFIIWKLLVMADPGFPVGGRGPRRGAWTPEAATFHNINLYVKTKESGPFGGAGCAPWIRQCIGRVWWPELQYILLKSYLSYPRRSCLLIAQCTLQCTLSLLGFYKHHYILCACPLWRANNG